MGIISDRIRKRREQATLNEETRPVDIPDDISTGTAKDVEAIMKKYDQESNTRTFEGLPAQILRFALAGFSLYLIYMNTFAVWDARIRLTSFLGLVLLLVFVLFPARKKLGTRVNHIPVYDLILAAAGLVACYY